MDYLVTNLRFLNLFPTNRMHLSVCCNTAAVWICNYRICIGWRTEKPHALSSLSCCPRWLSVGQCGGIVFLGGGFWRMWFCKRLQRLLCLWMPPPLFTMSLCLTAFLFWSGTLAAVTGRNIHRIKAAFKIWKSSWSYRWTDQKGFSFSLY